MEEESKKEIKENFSYDSLKTSVDTLRELQLTLEPVRDKALDEKARLLGYSQCAEQMIKIIVSKMADMEGRMKQVEEEELSAIKNKMLELEKTNKKKVKVKG